MAEDPHGWDVLVSSLAVWDLNTDARRAWAFLVVQNLVRDDTEDRNGFLTIVQEEIGCGPITGPTVALRVAARLHAIGVAVKSSDYPILWLRSPRRGWIQSCSGADSGRTSHRRTLRAPQVLSRSARHCRAQSAPGGDRRVCVASVPSSRARRASGARASSSVSGDWQPALQ